jgi:hypothetical protein
MAHKRRCSGVSQRLRAPRRRRRHLCSRIRRDTRADTPLWRSRVGGQGIAVYEFCSGGCNVLFHRQHLRSLNSHGKTRKFALFDSGMLLTRNASSIRSKRWFSNSSLDPSKCPPNSTSLAAEEPLPAAARGGTGGWAGAGAGAIASIIASIWIWNSVIFMISRAFLAL